MKNNIPLFFILLLSVLLMPQCADAQFLPGKDGKKGMSMEYRKVSGDSVRLRKSKAGKKRKKGGAVKGDKKNGKKAVAKKSARVKKSKVDSVAYKPMKYSLGDRVIMPGDSGHDVRSVADILVKKLYMDEALIKYSEDGGVVYEGELVRALKYFQEFNGLYPDGIIGSDVIKALRKRKN